MAQLASKVAKEIEATGKSDAFNTLPKHLDAATIAADRHVAALARIKDAFSGIATAAAAYAAIKLPQGAHSAFEQGKHIQHEERQLVNAGIPAEELDAAKKQILEIQKDRRKSTWRAEWSVTKSCVPSSRICAKCRACCPRRFRPKRR